MKLFSKTSFAVASAVAVIVIGCGKAKLTEEQKLKVQSLARSTSQGVGATFEASKAPGAVPPRRAARALDANEAREEKKRTDMVNKIRDGHCDFEVTPKDFERQLANIKSPAQLIPISFKATGATCPVFAEVKVTPNLSETGGKISFETVFEVKDAELKKLSDVTRVAFKSEISFSVDQNNGASSAKASLDGEIVSTEHGVVKLSMSLSGKGQGKTGEADFSFGMKFKDFEFAIEGKAKDGKTDLKLNGEPTTVEELQKFFSGALKDSPIANNGGGAGAPGGAIPGGGFPGGGFPPGGGPVDPGPGIPGGPGFPGPVGPPTLPEEDDFATPHGPQSRRARATTRERWNFGTDIFAPFH